MNFLEAKLGFHAPKLGRHELITPRFPGLKILEHFLPVAPNMWYIQISLWSFVDYHHVSHLLAILGGKKHNF
jgi:hypothetical protein